MNLYEVTRWRILLGKVGALFCLLFLISVFDALILQFRQPANSLQLLPGQSVEVNGPMKGNRGDLEELTYISSSDSLEITFDGLQTGYWLGGLMWRGSLSASFHARPGDYSLKVLRKDDAPGEKPSSVFLVTVYEDEKSMRKDSKSFLRRYFSISPWWGFAFFFPLTLLAAGGVFLLSHKRESLLAQQGMAEVYRVSKSEGGYEIAFGLGSRHGVEPGAILVLMNEKAIPVGHAKVEEAFEDDSKAIVEADCTVKHGYIVSLKE